MASLFRRKPAATVAVAPAEPPPPPPPEEEEPPVELEAQELPFQEPPIDQAAADGDEFTGARLRRVREQLTAEVRAAGAAAREITRLHSLPRRRSVGAAAQPAWQPWHWSFPRRSSKTGFP